MIVPQPQQERFLWLGHFFCSSCRVIDCYIHAVAGIKGSIRIKLMEEPHKVIQRIPCS
jgi:hypothetical protein